MKMLKWCKDIFEGGDGTYWWQNRNSHWGCYNPPPKYKFCPLCGKPRPKFKKVINRDWHRNLNE